MKAIKFRLIVMNFLIFAVWGAYLTSMGSYLANAGLGAKIGWFYSIQGIVSLFMPALIGIVADKRIPANRLLGICHGIAAICMAITGYIGMTYGKDVTFTQLFISYTISVAFFMPTIALGNSVSYSVLTQAGLDTVKAFPPIRVFGTIGFIISMLLVNFIKANGVSFQMTYNQFFVSAIWGIILAVYAFTLPTCPVNRNQGKTSLVDALGLRAFSLFKDKKMCLFFIFSMLLGVSLQITNGYANPFISSFAANPDFQNLFFTKNANLLISLSQLSETLCILLIPFFLRKYGIKKVMLIAMLAWVLRFAFFGLGDTGSGVWLLILSCIVYGVAFDFFNISGSLFVEKETDENIRSSAQGVFMMMTNGFGATIGTLSAQAIVNAFTHYEEVEGIGYTVGNAANSWSTVWYIFAAFALVVAMSFAIVFKYKHNSEAEK